MKAKKAFVTRSLCASLPFASLRPAHSGSLDWEWRTPRRDSVVISVFICLPSRIVWESQRSLWEHFSKSLLHSPQLLWSLPHSRLHGSPQPRSPGVFPIFCPHSWLCFSPTCSLWLHPPDFSPAFGEAFFFFVFVSLVPHYKKYMGHLAKMLF